MTRKPHLVREIVDGESGLTAYLVIDTLTGGRSCGGVRMLPDVTLEEVKSLARSMTMKYAFLNDRTVGGAKAGIAIPYGCPSEKKKKILQSFGRQIAPLIRSRQYLPWTDMNAGREDIAIILRAAGMKPKKMPDSSHPTALSVFASIQAACRFTNRDPSKITVAIEGLGKVGTHLARELSASGAKILACSTHQEARYYPEGFDPQDTKRPHERIDHPALLELDVDVLVPAARPGSINETNAPRLRAKIITPAANNPITPEAEQILVGKGTLSIPDFIANLGGIYGSRLNGRMSKKRIHHLFMGPYAEMVLKLLRRAEETNQSPRQLAERIAEENLALVRQTNPAPFLRRAALSLLDLPLTPNPLSDRLLYIWARKDLSGKVPSPGKLRR